MIGLLVSVGALLVAAAGVARHIRLHRARLRQETTPLDPAQETDLEREP
jgi:hypothetical protein